MTVKLMIATAIAACIAGTAQAQAQEARSPIETTRAMGSVTIPPEYVKAVIPYMTCLHKALGELTSASNGLDEAEFAAAGPVVREKCAAVRRAALDQGVQMLTDRKIGAAKDRPSRVEATLADIENTVLNFKFPAPVSGTN